MLKNKIIIVFKKIKFFVIKIKPKYFLKDLLLASLYEYQKSIWYNLFTWYNILFNKKYKLIYQYYECMWIEKLITFHSKHFSKIKKALRILFLLTINDIGSLSMTGFELIESINDVPLEIEAGTDLMLQNEVGICLNENNNYLIPSQRLEQILPGDFYHLNKNEIVGITEFKYITKDANILPSKFELLHKNLYYNHCKLKIGSINNSSILKLQKLSESINNLDREIFFKEEFLKEENLDYLLPKYKKKVLNEIFTGRYSIDTFQNKWLDNSNLELNKILDLKQISTTKQFRSELMNNSTIDEIIKEKIKKDQLNVLTNYNNINTSEILSLFETRLNKRLPLKFHEKIELIDLNKLNVNKCNLKIKSVPEDFNTVKKYISVFNNKKIFKYKKYIRKYSTIVKPNNLFKSDLYTIYINNFSSLICSTFSTSKLYFLTIKNKDFTKYESFFLLGVIEKGKDNMNKHYHFISKEKYRCSNCKVITNSKMDMNKILRYMQKEKYQFHWDFMNNTFKELEISSINKSLYDYQCFLEQRQKEQFSIIELKNELFKKYKASNSLIENTRVVILRYIQKLSLKLETSFDKLLIHYLKKINYSRNNSIELVQINILLNSNKIILHTRSLLWYLLYLVIFVGGLSEITLQTLYHKIGFYITNTFEDDLSLIKSDKFYYRLGSLLYDALELSLKENKVILWSKKTDLQISILETVNKYVHDSLSIKKNFLEYLKVEPLLENTLAMIIPPKLNTGYINLPNIHQLTNNALNTNFELYDLGLESIDYLQQVRYKINNNMLNYLELNLDFFISLFDSEKPELVNMPDFKKHRLECVTLLENEFSNKEINKSFLIDKIIDLVIITVSKMKIVNNLKLSSNIKVRINKTLLSTGYTGLYSNSLYSICKEQIIKNKKLLLEYSRSMEYKNKLKGFLYKIENIKKTLHTLKSWSSEYIVFDNKESLYFVWRVDHRGRLYPISNLNMMSNKIIRFCLEPLYSYSFKDYYNDIIIDISKNYFGVNTTDDNNIKKFNANIEKWLKNKKYYISKADSIYGFTRSLLEYESYLKDANYKTSYLISLDGTSNVYQHIACLTRDKELAVSVNLINNIGEPNDLYNNLLTALKDKKKHEDIKRSTIKKSVMCYAYGLTSHGRYLYLKEKLPNYDSNDLLDLSNDLFNTLKSLYPGIVIIRKVLEELVFLKSKQYLTVKVKNKFIKWEHKKTIIKKKVFSYVKPFSSNRSKRRIYLLENTNKLDISKMKTSITANYIHSLDSQSLMRTILLYKKRTKNKPLFTIHDCFMVPAPYKNVIIDCFKQSFIDIYSTEQIKDLYTYNNEKLSKEIKSKNNFDIKDIKDSKYILI